MAGWHRSRWTPTLLPTLLLAATLATVLPAAAQTCFNYVDGCPALPPGICTDAPVPIDCRQQGNLAAACSWNQNCFDDNNASDCCTTVPSATPQTLLEMHTAWHDCFGNVGASDGDNPPGRGQRWYAFHRQFEYDQNVWRDQSFPIGHIESLEWCPGMSMLAHPGTAVGHPAGCGTGNARPGGTACRCCQAFPPCLFHTGGGPTDCVAGATPTGADLTTCAAQVGTQVVPAGTCGSPASVTFPYNSLDDFANVEEVAVVLDDYFHGAMHGAVAYANNGTTIPDASDPNCSPRDPMFWRLHKAIDDVVRAWQDSKPVDVVLVIDTSGSMSGAEAGGGTKYQAALEAAEMFASLLPDCDPDPTAPAACDVAANRIGLVTYSSSVATALPLTVVNPTLLTPGGAFDTALTSLQGATPSGCTGMGLGIQRALELLCPPGDCEGFSAPGDNDRKAILLLTDGVENVPPCLNPAGAAGGTCGNQCFGAELDYDTLEFTQLVAVGVGTSGTINDDTLTLLAERQGGIYLHDPNATSADDLKYFYSMAFGRLTDEFNLADPRGVMASSHGASEPVEYSSCGDSRLTFSSGWQQPVSPGGLRLLVETPAGDLLRASDPAVENDWEPTWEFARWRRAAASGTWRAQLVRPHSAYVNGFTPDAFADLDQGTQVVRRQIQRLCPDGCKRALLFESGLLGTRSAYAEAVELELAAGVLGAVERIDRGDKLAEALLRQRWDLLVYARAGEDRPERYDRQLTQLLCSGQRAVVTDTRRGAAALLRCAGALRDGNDRWEAMNGDGSLFAGEILFDNPGHEVATYGLVPSPSTQATAIARRESGAVSGRFERGEEHHWFINVHGRGLSKLDPHVRTSVMRTGDDLTATVRILPSYNPAGGYDRVDARVEVTYPVQSVGTLLAEIGLDDEKRVNGELLSRRAATLLGVAIPTKTATFPLYDDGTRGDLHAGNGYWTARLPAMGAVDGSYRFRFILDLTKNGCTTRREMAQNYIVALGTDPRASDPRVVTAQPGAGGTRRATVRMRPADRFGNLWGPGRTTAVACDPEELCRVDAKGVIDHGDGSYTVHLDLAPGVAGTRLDAFGTSFVLPMPCEGCPGLAGIELETDKAPEHGQITGVVTLDRPAPKTGAVVFLTSSNRDAAYVLESVAVPPGKAEAEFQVYLLHAHDGPAPAVITARYGGGAASVRLTVTPLPPPEPVPPGEIKRYPGHARHAEADRR